MLEHADVAGADLMVMMKSQERLKNRAGSPQEGQRNQTQSGVYDMQNQNGRDHGSLRPSACIKSKLMEDVVGTTGITERKSEI